MQHSDITDDLAKLAFDFFYLYSRFELALKECGYLESKKPGAKAKPNWNGFVEEWDDRYSLLKRSQTVNQPPWLRSRMADANRQNR